MPDTRETGFRWRHLTDRSVASGLAILILLGLPLLAACILGLVYGEYVVSVLGLVVFTLNAAMLTSGLREELSWLARMDGRRSRGGPTR